MLLSELPQALDINPCPRAIVCNYCEVIHMSVDILNAGGNVEDEDKYGFTGQFFKKFPIIIDDNTKMQFMNMQRTPKANIDEQILNNPISENIGERKRLTGGI